MDDNEKAAAGSQDAIPLQTALDAYRRTDPSDAISRQAFRKAYDQMLAHSIQHDSHENALVSQRAADILQDLFDLMARHREIADLAKLYRELFKLNLTAFPSPDAIDRTTVRPKQVAIAQKYLRIINALLEDIKVQHLALMLGLDHTTMQRHRGIGVQGDPPVPHIGWLATFIGLCGYETVDDFLNADDDTLVAMLRRTCMDMRIPSRPHLR